MRLTSNFCALDSSPLSLSIQHTSPHTIQTPIQPYFPPRPPLHPSLPHLLPDSETAFPKRVRLPWNRPSRPRLNKLDALFKTRSTAEPETLMLQTRGPGRSAAAQGRQQQKERKNREKNRIRHGLLHIYAHSDEWKRSQTQTATPGH